MSQRRALAQNHLQELLARHEQLRRELAFLTDPDALASHVLKLETELASLLADAEPVLIAFNAAGRDVGEEFITMKQARRQFGHGRFGGVMAPELREEGENEFGQIVGEPVDNEPPTKPGFFQRLLGG